MPASSTPYFDYERASRALAQAAFEGDEKAAQEEGLSARSVKRYRARMADDPYLAGLVKEKMRLLEYHWANKLAPAIRSVLDFLERAGREANPKDPEVIHAMAGALKLATEAEVTKKVIDARLAETDRTSREAPRGVASEGDGVQAN